MSATFNVSEFDRTVKEFYEGSHAEMQAAQKTLTNFQHDLNSWQVVDQILEQSSYLQTKVDNKQKEKKSIVTYDNLKFIALNIFEEFVKVRWNTLPKEQRFALRNYIANLVIHISSNENAIAVQDLLLGKLNVVLIQIVKKEWPKYWPTFIEEIVNSSFTNINLCKNNLRIIKLLRFI
jgi:exportin-1